MPVRFVPWSSDPVYAVGVENLLVDDDPFYAPLGPTAYQRQEAYRAFVRLDNPYAQVRDATFLDEPF